MEILIGSAADCHIRYQDDRVSRHHCRLLLQDGRLFISDLGSTNGTWMNKKKIAANSWVPLNFGETVHLAGLIPLPWDMVEKLLPNSAGRTRQVDSARINEFMAGQSAPAVPRPPTVSVPPAGIGGRRDNHDAGGQQQPIIMQQQSGSSRNDILYAVHAGKSYVGSAFLTWILYYVGFYIIGLIMNFVYLNQASETERITGSSPSGMGCLQLLIFVHLVLPIILIILIVLGVVRIGSLLQDLF